MILTIALMMELGGSFIGLRQKVRGELQSVEGEMGVRDVPTGI